MESLKLGKNEELRGYLEMVPLSRDFYVVSYEKKQLFFLLSPILFPFFQCSS